MMIKLSVVSGALAAKIKNKQNNTVNFNFNNLNLTRFFMIKNIKVKKPINSKKYFNAIIK